MEIADISRLNKVDLVKKIFFFKVLILLAVKFSKAYSLIQPRDFFFSRYLSFSEENKVQIAKELTPHLVKWALVFPMRLQEGDFLIL